jgi:hypothetical protein
VSKFVARSAAFRRSLEGVPVFGSELVIGLVPDGTIGRFRLHWPKIDEEVCAGGEGRDRTGAGGGAENGRSVNWAFNRVWDLRRFHDVMAVCLCSHAADRCIVDTA